MQKRIARSLVVSLAILVLGALAWYLGSPLLLNRTVEEQLPFEVPSQAETEAMPDSELEVLAEEVMETAAAMPDKPMEEDMPEQELAIVKSGEIAGADQFHQGSGTATIFELPDGSQILRLEDFMVTNGPDLHVLLAAGANPMGREDLGEYIDLGELKGNIGNQNYEIPPGVELADYNSVVIYCVPFHVLFAHADL